MDAHFRGHDNLLFKLSHYPMIQTEESIMKNMHVAMLIVAIGFSALVGGCKSSEKITRASQLPVAPTEGDLKVLMNDSTLYELQTFALRDSLVVGTGNKIQEGKKQNFSGALNIHNIAYIQSNKSAPLKDFIAAGAAVFFLPGSYSPNRLIENLSMRNFGTRTAYYHSSIL